MGGDSLVQRVLAPVAGTGDRFRFGHRGRAFFWGGPTLLFWDGPTPRCIVVPERLNRILSRRATGTEMGPA
ncbi:MAG: hypothetical protein ACRD0I_07875 [Acidimicrobiales bacterium]